MENLQTVLSLGSQKKIEKNHQWSVLFLALGDYLSHTITVEREKKPKTPGVCWLQYISVDNVKTVH